MRPENGRFHTAWVIFLFKHNLWPYNFIFDIDYCCFSFFLNIFTKFYHRIFNLAYIQRRPHFFPHFCPNCFPELFLGTEGAKITWKKVSCWPLRGDVFRRKKSLNYFFALSFFCFIHYSTYRHIGYISWEEISDKDFFHFSEEEFLVQGSLAPPKHRWGTARVLI